MARRAGLWPARRPGFDIELRTPIGAAAYVVIDTELTGLRPRTDSIISIGALHMDGGRILVGSPFNRLVRPRTEITGSSVVIHGITPGETSRSPEIASVLPEFDAFCAGRILVGHAVSIDLDFLDAEAERLGAASLAAQAVDTMALSRYLCGKTDGHCAFHVAASRPLDLYTLAREFQIPVSRAHDALYDAYLTAQIFQHFLAVLPAHGVRTVGELIEIGQP